MDSIPFDIQAAIREFQEVTFVYAPHSCNKAVHEVASFVRRAGGSFY